MDLNLLTIARRANLGSKIIKAFENANNRILQIENITNKVGVASGFSDDEKLQSREFAIIGLVSVTEQLLNEILHQVLVSHPKKFGNKKFEIDELIEEGSILELFYSKANQKLLDLAYGKFDRFVKNFTETLDLKTEINLELIETVNEIKCTRDCLIHSEGKSTELYFSKVGNKARARGNNKTLKIDNDYYTQSVTSLKTFISDIEMAIPDKLLESNMSYIFKQMWIATCLNSRLNFDAVWVIESSSMVRPKNIEDEFGFSSSEMAVYNLFRYIYSGSEKYKVDFAFYFKRWKPQSKEYQIAISWLDNQFYF
nr:hypothetical protein [uncultured Draconibacterium sp.]